MSNIFHDDETNLDLGERLANIKNANIVNDKLLMAGISNSITPLPISNFGKNLINVADLNTLVRILSQGDSNATITDTGLGSFEVNIDGQLIASADVNSFKIKWNKTLYVSSIDNELNGSSILINEDLSNRSLIPSSNDIYSLGGASNVYSNGYITQLNSNNVYLHHLHPTTGNNIINLYAGLKPHTTDIYDLGSSSKKYANLWSVNGNITNLSIDSLSESTNNGGIVCNDDFKADKVYPTTTTGSIVGADATPYDTGYINSVYTNNVLSRGYDLNLYHTGTNFNNYIKMNSALNETHIDTISSGTFHNLNIRSANQGYVNI